MEAVAHKYPRVKNYISGRFLDDAKKTIDVYSPLSGEVISSVPLSTSEMLDAAVNSAKTIFPIWSSTPVKERVQVFYKYRSLLEKNLQELASIIHEENGKTMNEAIAEIEKSIELTEFACSLPQLVTGEMLEVSRGVECRVENKALGVVASIAPFNFPHMVPHWTIPNAIALGNCMILKPSEQVPLSSNRIAEMLKEADYRMAYSTS
jgi:malonate-semialdehyde dehydrogenase (acetylating)/methylmalonate-semialdehyde dehydrogenase